MPSLPESGTSTGNADLSSCGPRLSQRASWAGDQPISYLMHKALAHPELISLAAGFVDQQSLPLGLTREALDAILSDPQRGRAALQYGTTQGYLPLREIIVDRHKQADGRPETETELSEDQVVVTAGSNQLLHLVSECLFDPGDIVLCTSPSYFVYLGVLQNLGVRAVGVDMDEDGMIPEALKEQFARLEASGELARVKAIYLVDYFDNPSSVTLSADRRPEIVDIAKKWSQEGPIHILEDAAYRELRYAGEDVPSLRAFDAEGETVIVAGTYSKSFSPGIRVGWGILPKSLVEPVCGLKGNVDFGSPNFAQHLMAAVFEQELYEVHVQRLCREYHAKLKAMLDASEKHLAPLPGVEFLRPEGGLYVWLKVPAEIDTGPEGQLFDLALEEGILYVPGQYCFPAEGMPAARNTIRLSFGVQTPERIREGIEALARAIGRAIE